MTPGKKITIKDIAREAGVSSYTVSKILNGQPESSQETQKRVNKIIQRLKYKPDPIAQGMRRKSFSSITILFPYEKGRFSTQYFDELLRGINDASQQFGQYVLIVIENEKDRENSGTFLQTIEENPLLNNIIVVAPRISHIKQLKKSIKSKKMVLINAKDAVIPSVGINNYQVMYKMVENLVLKGHKTIGYLNTKDSYFDADERLKAYKDVLKKFHLDVDESIILSSNYNLIGAGIAVDQFLKNKKLTAIVTFSDFLAAYVLKILYKKGIKVPEQIVVTGFDNIRFSEIMIPSLTTIQQPLYEMGKMAVEMILSRQEQKSIEFEGKIIYRESTGHARTE